MTTQYRLTAAPRHASLRQWDCHFCRHEALASPVWLLSESGATVAAGTGCAARVLFGDAEPATVRRLRASVDEHRAAARAAAAEARSWQRTATAALEQFRAGRDGAPALGCARRAFHARGGMPVLGPFPTWLEQVATTGEPGELP